MKKRQKVIALISIILALIIGVVLYAHQPKEQCSQHDKDINNCVPAGRCAPPGVSDATIDCDNSQEHKFNTEL